jgi:transcriptional antiterminator RfaH
MERYYVVQTRPQKESTAAYELKNQGFRTFFPVIRSPRPAKQGKILLPRLSPLFPKYLFVQLDLDLDPWRSINGTRGVVRVMCMDEYRPSPVPVLAMTRLLDAGEVIEEATASLPFNLGDTVEFTDGSMKGRQGLVSACAENRVTLLLDLLGRQTLVQCEPKSLKYISK